MKKKSRESSVRIRSESVSEYNRNMHDELKKTKPDIDLSIVNALILETEGQVGKALQLIREQLCSQHLFGHGKIKML